MAPALAPPAGAAWHPALGDGAAANLGAGCGTSSRGRSDRGHFRRRPYALGRPGRLPLGRPAIGPVALPSQPRPCRQRCGLQQRWPALRLGPFALGRAHAPPRRWAGPAPPALPVTTRSATTSTSLSQRAAKEPSSSPGTPARGPRPCRWPPTRAVCSALASATPAPTLCRRPPKLCVSSSPAASMTSKPGRATGSRCSVTEVSWSALRSGGPGSLRPSPGRSASRVPLRPLRGAALAALGGAGEGALGTPGEQRSSA